MKEISDQRDELTERDVSRPQVILNFVATAVKVVASGVILVDRERYNERLDECKSCPMRTSDETPIACRACGCNMAIKARFLASGCPLNPNW